MAVVGIGVDVVDIARFEQSLARTPALTERLFVESERGLPLPSLAARCMSVPSGRLFSSGASAART